MSFDPFEIRIQFLQLLKRLNASQQSIHKVVGFAVKYGSRCGEDLWECVMEECSKASLNTRINILYLLDSLFDACLSIGPPDAPYLKHVSEDLSRVVENVVPATREGILNLKAAKQILESWRLRRILDPNIIDASLEKLEKHRFVEMEEKKRSHEQAFSKNDILRRMEEDRERHKRLRERIWILPIPPLRNTTKPSPTPSPFTPASPSTGRRGNMAPPPPPPPPHPSSSSDTRNVNSSSSSGGGSGHTSSSVERKMKIEGGVSGKEEVEEKDRTKEMDPLNVEFDQLWENVSDLDEDDLEKMKEYASAVRS